jgi:predicted nucleic-acid-binding protein
MIGLDTNVIVRYLTHDDRAQSAAASRMFRTLTQEEPGFLSLIVVAELVWVLESCYSFEKAEVVRVLEILLRSKELIVERAEIAWQALRKFATGNADFADFLIERCGHTAGCHHTFTFDQKAAGAAGMRLLKL